MGKMSGSRFVALAALMVALAACSESSLADLGERSSGWIGDPTGGGAIEAGGNGQPQVVRSVEVAWVNDELTDTVPQGEPQEVLAQIVDRTTGPERYIQATRLEIAATLPGMTFPDLVPPEVIAISSQIVVSTTRDRLDDEVYAAFGLWTVEPYTRSRSVGQRGTFIVAGLTPDSACDRFAAGAVASCTTETIGGFDVVRIDAESGQTWIWEDDTYEYQLYLRGSLDANESVADFMIRNEVPFVTVADPTARVLGTTVTTGEEPTEG